MDATIRLDLLMSDPRMLFNLQTDPGEFHNLTDEDVPLASRLWEGLDHYLSSVEARRSRGNSAAYHADNGKEFEAHDRADRRDTFAPFEGRREPKPGLNDRPPGDAS